MPEALITLTATRVSKVVATIGGKFVKLETDVASA